MSHAWYVGIPVAVAFAGSVLFAVWRPGARLVGGIQHFTAGVNFSAASVEILPDLAHRGSILPLLIGSAVGVAAMLTVDAAASRARGSLGFLVSAAVDVVMDGVVLGLGFALGERQGVLLLIAITMEIAFLGISITAALGDRLSSTKMVLASAGLSLALPLGVLASTPMDLLPGPVQQGVFAFGLIAILFLVTEGLLVEAHEKPEPPWATALFYVGFIGLVAIDDFLR